MAATCAPSFWAGGSVGRTRALRAELRVGDVPLMAEGEPEVEAGLRRNVQLVVRHVVAHPVAAVVGEPQLARHRVPIEPDAVAHAFGEDFLPGPIRLHPHDRRHHRRRRADVARRPDRHVQQVVRAEADELPRVAGLRVRQVVANRDRRGRCVEVFFDVVEPQEPARGGHIQRAVPHRDAIGLIETAGDHHDTIGLVVAVGIHNGVDLAGILRSDEHRSLRTERHRAGVLHLLGEHVRLKSCGQHQRGERRRALTGGDRQAGREHGRQHDERPGRIRHETNSVPGRVRRFLPIPP